MNILLPILSIFFLSAVVADAAELIRLKLKTGELIEGQLEKLDVDKFLVRMELKGGSARQGVTFDRVDSITLARSGEEDRLATTTQLSDLRAVRDIWTKRAPFLKFKGSDSGQFGQTLASLLIKRQDTNATAIAEVQDLIRVLREDWDTARAARLTSLQLQLELLAGNIDKAIDLAQKMADLSPDNAGAIIDAKFAMAETMAAQLKAFDKENPLYFEVRDKRIEREELLQRALDLYLFPVVFNADAQAACSRGLFRFAALASANDRHTEAWRAADEIENYYSSPEYLSAAREIKKKADPYLPADFIKGSTNAPSTTSSPASKEKKS